MSGFELTVVIGCLAAGYFFTSRIIDGRETEGTGDSSETTDEPGNADYSHHANNREEPEAQRPEQPLSARECFDILGVSAGARADEIRLAYQRKIAQYHPDKVSGLGDKIQATAEAESKRINSAYDYLKTRGYA